MIYHLANCHSENIRIEVVIVVDRRSRFAYDRGLAFRTSEHQRSQPYRAFMNGRFLIYSSAAA
jgi:hypothetical protein